MTVKDLLRKRERSGDDNDAGGDDNDAGGDDNDAGGNDTDSQRPSDVELKEKYAFLMVFQCNTRANNMTHVVTI